MQVQSAKFPSRSSHEQNPPLYAHPRLDRLRPDVDSLLPDIPVHVHTGRNRGAFREPDQSVHYLFRANVRDDVHCYGTPLRFVGGELVVEEGRPNAWRADDRTHRQHQTDGDDGEPIL